MTDRPQEAAPSARDALQELVAVKALKDRMETLTDPTVKAPMTAAEVDEYNALRAEYAGRKPIAWANARAALSKQEAATPAIPSDVPRLHDFIRREVERAIDEAVNPKGMSVHDGKARIGSDKLAYMLKLIDNLYARAALKAAQPVPLEPAPMTREWCAAYPGAAAGIINRLARQVDATRPVATGYAEGKVHMAPSVAPQEPAEPVAWMCEELNKYHGWVPVVMFSRPVECELSRNPVPLYTQSVADAQDAVRYRWLRDAGSVTWISFRTQWHLDSAGCDAVIDKEMARVAAMALDVTKRDPKGKARSNDPKQKRRPPEDQ
jgi:hypothetical protein